MEFSERQRNEFDVVSKELDQVHKAYVCYWQLCLDMILLVQELDERSGINLIELGLAEALQEHLFVFFQFSVLLDLETCL